MEPIPCPCCNTFFIPRNKLQTFCSKPDCQRARKALWQKQKLSTDPEYKKGQCLAQQKWLQNRPDYWKDYRRRNPEKAARNRSLQKIRNMKKQKKQPLYNSSKSICIAKMDASKSFSQSLLGQFWLVPTIAKMDPVKIFIARVTVDSK